MCVRAVRPPPGGGLGETPCSLGHPQEDAGFHQQREGGDVVGDEAISILPGQRWPNQFQFQKQHHREREEPGMSQGPLGTGGAAELTALGWASSQRDAQCLLTITAKFSQAQLLTSQAKYVRWLFTC